MTMTRTTRSNLPKLPFGPSAMGVLTFVAACLLAPRSAQAQAFPIDTWKGLEKDGNPLTDLSGDATGESFLDLVGDVGFPAISIARDADFLYFRMRVDGDPSDGGGFADFGWGCGLDNDGDYAGYEYLIFINGQSEYVELWSNLNDQGSVVGAPSDPGDTEIFPETRPTSTFARIVLAGAPDLGVVGTPDHIIAFAVPLNDLVSAGYDPSKPVVVFCGSNASGGVSSLATDCSTTGFGCNQVTITYIGSDPVSCDASGCATCNSNDSCGAACAPCTDPTPSCDPATLNCGPCGGDSDCSGVTPYCVTSGTESGWCVECLGDANCLPGETCNLTSYSCERSCLGDEDCTAATPACELTSSICVECTNQTYCGVGEVCDTDAFTCVECVNDEDCAEPAVCDPAGQVCVECFDHSQCGADLVCDTRINTCVGCVDDGDCSSPAPACNLVTQVCVECTSISDSECTPVGEVCDGANNVCVGCLGDADCTSPTPVCDTSSALCVECIATNVSECTANGKLCNALRRVCVECLRDSDCGTGDSGRVCDANGVCTDGCRGSRGNGCPSRLVCSSLGSTIGQCVTPTGGGGAGGGGASGFGGVAGAPTIAGAAGALATTGGVSTGGATTGGVSTGGATTGGVSAGGATTGGVSTGGEPTGGDRPGGSPTAGSAGTPAGGEGGDAGAAGAPVAGSAGDTDNGLSLEGGGCGCEVPYRRVPNAAWLLAVLPLAVLAGRRRRR